MKSSSGQYFAGLDHVRAIAAFLVVVWHFTHSLEGKPVPFNKSPWLGPLDEGHLGVAVFMTLSGYLFAKIIHDQRIRYWTFLYNRILRLAPLLVVTIAIHFILNRPDPFVFAKVLIGGALLPQLPNGGWSITAEAHFYVALPLLLAMFRRSLWWAVAALGLSLSVRAYLFANGADIQHLSYFTIIGRLDQFVLGILAFRIGKQPEGVAALFAGTSLWGFYAWFDYTGGFYAGDLPALWIAIPTFEAVTIATMIAWYDNRPPIHFGLLQKAGEYSYSIYLLHFFVVHQVAMAVDRYVMDISTLPRALPWAVAFFVAMTAVGWLSWTLVERPPLRWRRPYLIEREVDDNAIDAARRVTPTHR